MTDLNEWKQGALKKIDETAERIAELDKKRFAASEKGDERREEEITKHIAEELTNAALAGLAMFLAAERGINPGIFALLLASGRVADALKLKAPEKKEGQS